MKIARLSLIPREKTSTVLLDRSSAARGSLYPSISSPIGQNTTSRSSLSVGEIVQPRLRSRNTSARWRPCSWNDRTVCLRMLHRFLHPTR